jgi:hypothetical protein
MALTHKQIDDFVQLTQVNYELTRDKWVDLSLALQHYHWASRWFKSKKQPVHGGPELEWEIRTANQGSAKHAGLFAVDTTNRKDVMTGAKQGFSKQTANYIYDLDEPRFQGSPETIIRWAEIHEQGLANDIIELMETAMWTAPSSSTLDPMPPSGIPFWIQKPTTLGFNGGDPSGWATGAGGKTVASLPSWQNYGGPYTVVDRDDMIEKAVNACDFCDFRAPTPFNEIAGGTPTWGFYTVHSVLSTMRKLLEKQNDSLGREVAWGAGGEVMLRGNPIVWVPALTNSASDAYDSEAPFYGINWNTMFYFYQEGRDMIKFPPYMAPMQKTVRIRAVDNWGNFLCTNRRANFILYVAS